MKILKKGEMLSKEVFIGGPLRLFETAGRMQLILLLNEGLYPDSRVLDIGCGCLRGGYWLIHFLRPGHYFGIEPNSKMLSAGIRELLEPGLLEEKSPKFDNNPDFDFSVFGEEFDFLVARSIWTHAAKGHIRTMLDGFIHYSTKGAIFLTSYKRASLFRHDYDGQGWMGRSHESNEGGMVYHRLDWIQEECRQRGLVAEEIREKAYNFGRQTWLRIKRRTPGA